MQLYRLYHPVTAAPLTGSDAQREYPPPPALAPWVRCFWGSARPAVSGWTEPVLVVPDTCADLIYTVDHTAGIVTGRFSPLQTTTFTVPGRPGNGHLVSTFAIRFYGWAAATFADDSLRGTQNGGYPAEQYFPALHRALAPRLLECTAMPARIALAADRLLASARPTGADALLHQVVGTLVLAHGRLKTAELARELFLSPRQLERIVSDRTGTTPKALADLLRYQCLWQELLHTPGLDIQDAVEKYGFTDQAHLLCTFKRFHSLTPRQALLYARGGRGKNVAFLQDGDPRVCYTGVHTTD